MAKNWLLAPLLLCAAMLVITTALTLAQDNSKNYPPLGQAPGQAAQATAASAQSKLVSHALMAETELLSARDRLRGIRAQLKAVPSRASQDDLRNLLSFGQQFENNVNAALTQEAQLRAQANLSPSLAKSADLGALSSAIGNLQRLNSDWQLRMPSAGYWKSKDRVFNDLDTLESSVTNALSQTRAFSTDLLNIANVPG